MPARPPVLAPAVAAAAGAAAARAGAAGHPAALGAAFLSAVTSSRRSRGLHGSLHRRLLPCLALTCLTSSALFSTGGSEGGSSSSSSGACLSSGMAADRHMEDAIRRLVPPLSYGARKGQMGRIGVLGGSADFTGAPYYAGMASLKVGGDLSYILTAEEASGPLKTYSPELMVTPVYSAHRLLQQPGEDKGEKERAVAAMVKKVTFFFPKLHALVIGPGLGRDPWVLEATRRVILEARRAALPLVIDADGLWLVAQRPEVVRDFPEGCPVVLTPNLIEFARLQAGVAGAPVASATPSAAVPERKDVMELAKMLGGKVTICLKGPTDIIADGERWLAVEEPGTLRRSGGLGDILAGTMGVLVHWARLALPISDVEGHPGTGLPQASAAGAAAGAIGPEMESRDRALWACAAASVIARRAGRRAFAQKRRSMTAPDAIAHLGEVLEELAPTEMD